jgi:hypothetical protein
MAALALHVEGLIEDGTTLSTPRTAAAIKTDPDLVTWQAGADFVWIPLISDVGSPRRVNISLDSDLLAAIDAEAKRRNMTRSALLASAVRKEINAA